MIRSWTRSTALSRALGLGALLTLATGPAGAAGLPRFRRMVVVGDSLLAGFGSGGFVAGGVVGQRHDAPALIARRARVRLLQPLMDQPGVPAPLEIKDANRNRRLEPGDVQRSSSAVGFRKEPKQGVRNLAVPGESIQSVFSTLSAAEVARGLADRSISGRDTLKFLILGLPLRDDSVSQVTRANDIHPTFILAWLGNNDVLPMATQTNPAAATMSPAEFGVQYRRLLNRLADAGSEMAVANLPDVTQIAELRRAAGEVTSCREANGTEVPVASESLLSIGLNRVQLPIPPCGRVLDPAERAQVRATVTAFNAEIAAAIVAVEQQRGVTIAAVDMFALFDGVARNGADIRGDGSVVLTSGYLGGLFSLDGTHPTRTGQALVANAFIDAINARFGAGVRRVNVARIAARDRLVNNRYRPSGEPPFGLIKDEGVDVGDTLEHALGELVSNAGGVLDDLKHKIGGVFDDIGNAF